MTVVLPKAKDNAKGQLNAGINASVLSIPLKTGEGTLFPQPYTATCSSTGSRTVLNSAGNLASLAVGDFIRNVTDGSWAFVVTAGTNSITTTRLQGGTLNVWTNADTWRANEFIVTIAKINSSGVDTQYEEVLISNRSTDTLTVATGGRGYNSTTAQSFDADDYVQLRVTSPYHEEMKKLLKELATQVDSDIASHTASIATLQTDVDNVESGVSFYVAAAGSANAFTATYSPVPAYAAGLQLSFKANHSITGTTTINVNGLGAKTIKKNDGATNLITGDIINGQIVELEYDGTNFQMLSPAGTPPTAQYFDKTVSLIASSSATIGASSTSELDFATHTLTIPANDLISGVAYHFEVSGSMAWVSGVVSISVKLGATRVFNALSLTPAGTAGWSFKGTIYGTAPAGASVAVRGEGTYVQGESIRIAQGSGEANFATNGALVLQFAVQYGASNGSHGSDIDMSKFTKHATTAF